MAGSRELPSFTRERIRDLVLENDAGTERLLEDIAAAPLIPEHELGRLPWEQTIDRVNRRRLGPAELEVLIWASRGLQQHQIAEVLGKKLQTVKTQLVSARWKLGAENTTQACCEAIRRGLIV